MDLNITDIKAEFDLMNHIPKQLFIYLKNVIKKNSKEDAFYISLTDINHQKLVLDNIDKKFQQLSKILSLEPPEIIKGLDFNPKDIATGRIEAFLAEIRAVIFLNELGFKNIKLLKAISKKRADLYGEYLQDKFAIEVFCSISGTYRWPNHSINRHDLTKYYVDRANEKKIQLQTASKDFGCSKKIIVMVLNSKHAVALLNHREFLSLLSEIKDILSWGEDYYFAIITGRETLGHGLDDAIFPQLV